VIQYKTDNTSINGIWWVLVDDLPMFQFQTRKDARDFCIAARKRHGGRFSPKPNGDICDVINKLGFATVLEHAHFLHPYERQALDLSLTGRRQTEVADLMGISQPSVCYILSRVSQRIEYLATRPKFDLDLMRKDLRDIPTLLPSDPGILVDYWVCGNQSSVARKYGRTQGWVRHRIQRTLGCVVKHTKWRAEAGVEWATRCMGYQSAVSALVSKGRIMTLVSRAR
jgi:hypothetical protein